MKRGTWGNRETGMLIWAATSAEGAECECHVGDKLGMLVFEAYLTPRQCGWNRSYSTVELSTSDQPAARQGWRVCTQMSYSCSNIDEYNLCFPCIDSNN
eukprot:2258070-Amphidinium_carterae.2